MTMIDSQTFQLRFLTKLEINIEAAEARAQCLPDNERRAVSAALADVARQYPDLLPLARRLEKEAGFVHGEHPQDGGGGMTSPKTTTFECPEGGDHDFAPLIYRCTKCDQNEADWWFEHQDRHHELGFEPAPEAVPRPK